MARPTKRTTVLAGLATAGAAGALGLALAAPALAEAPAPAPSGSAAPSGETDRAAARTQHQQELAAALAKELGVDQAKVAAALEKVHAARQAEAKTERTAALKTRLDEAVAAGKLTAEEAAAILKAAEANVLPGGPGGPGGAFGRGHGGFGR
ncbi:hypothetical protein [Jidongwangia harbinensis]|uniref:hypothetical protein n=1 Tax=Jidongwangia harbinensis TaxID=2878561 RepID=UPI001CDA53CB|nr:hypothetical protein [Jidongwangia harbinensis]MCA2211862.1 hypothetical protein [Jidongwangia harbinensis]